MQRDLEHRKFSFPTCCYTKLSACAKKIFQCRDERGNSEATPCGRRISEVFETRLL